MMLRDLQPASFRGASFKCPKDQLSEGRRIIDHQWPDSNRRYAEDNGFIPPEFTITAILHGPNLPGQVSRLRNALNTPGPGTLKHPWAGVVRCAVKGPAKWSREDTDSGVMTCEITLLRDDGAIYPALLSGIPAAVAGLAAQAIGNIASAFPEAFGAGAVTAASRTAIGTQIGLIGTTLTNGFGSSAETRTLERQSLSLADQPTRIAASLSMAVERPFEDITFTDSQMLQGLRALSDQGASTAEEALSFGEATGVTD